MKGGFSPRKSITIFEKKNFERSSIIKKTQLFQMLSKNPKISVSNFRETTENEGNECNTNEMIIDFNYLQAIKNRSFLNILMITFSLVVAFNFLMALIYSFGFINIIDENFIIMGTVFFIIISNNFAIYYLFEKFIYKKLFINNNWLNAQTFIGTYYCCLITIINVLSMAWVSSNPWFTNSKMGFLWNYLQYPLFFFCFLKLVEGLLLKILILFICQCSFVISVLFEDEKLRYYDYISFYCYWMIYFFIFTLIVYLQELNGKENLDFFINLKKNINDWKKIVNNFPHCFTLFDCLSEELVFCNDYGLNTFKIGVTKLNETSLESLSEFLGKLKKIRVTSENVYNTLRLSKSDDKIRNLIKEGNLKSILRNLLENSQGLTENQTFIYNTMNKLKLDYEIIDSSEIDERNITIKIKIITFENKQTFLLLFEDTTYQELITSLKETSEFKNKLLSSFSHELRTPLNGAIPLLESIQKEKQLIKKNSYYLETAINSLKILQNVLNDIVDYAQLNSGQIQLNCHEINPTEIITEAINILSGQAKEKSIKFNLFFDSDLPKFFFTDSNRLKQILLNLIRNSLKFSLFNGQIDFHVKFHSFKKLIEFKIIDKGIGISNTELEELKLLLKSLKNNDFITASAASSQNGNLGILITQNLALILGPSDSMGGLEIYSDGKSHGTTVNFFIEDKESFKLADGESPSILMVRSNIIKKKENNLIPLCLEKRNCSITKKALTWIKFEENKSFVSGELSDKGELGENVVIPNGVKEFKSNDNRLSFINQKKIYCCEPVMVVDDDPFNLLSAEVLIKRIGLKIKKAFNGKQAIEIIEKFEKKKCSMVCQGIRLILMDYSMPVMNGIEATKELIKKMKNKEIKEIPIVACTAFGAKEDINNCFEAGMVDYIQKPIEINLLKSIIEKYLS